MEDNQQIIYKFREIKSLLMTYLIQVLPDYHFTQVMMYTLEFLRKNPDCIAVDIANEFGLTRGAITQLLDKLEQQGLIVRQPHPTSRRSLKIHVTDKGNGIIENIVKDYNSKIEQLLVHYSAKELSTLRQLLEQLPI